MKKLLSSFSIVLIVFNGYSQNVGIGTSNPNSKLDVNGDFNTNGQIKLNGNAGTALQVLMKDASNTPVWGDLSSLKNCIVFDCTNGTNTAGANNCNYNWTVPANVTSIVIECWGGGGGGGTSGGGGGGGYITARIVVNAGDNALIQVGAGGFPSVLLGPNGIQGGGSFFRINGVSFFANGGFGAFPSMYSSGFTTGVADGGSFSSPNTNQNFWGVNGSAGDKSKINYTQTGTTEFTQIIDFGNGGDAGAISHSGGKGGYYFGKSGGTQNIFAGTTTVPGAGGGADANGGTAGKGGRIVVRW